MEFILVMKDIHEVSTFVSKNYPLSCLSTTANVERHESLNFLYLGQENLNYLASNNAIRRKLTFFLLGFSSRIVTFFIRKYDKSLKCW